MKIIDDICSSIAGNTKTRINDPFIGTFICSWIACNWNYLALLFWGEGKAGERISAFYIYLSQTSFWELNSLFFVPFFIALFYLFAFPWISLLIKSIQKMANEKLHQQAVDVDLSKVNQQEELNKAKLRANPDKQFLEQLVQQDIDKKAEIFEHIKQRTIRLEAKSKEALNKEKEQAAKTQDAENKAIMSQQDKDKKAKQAELDRARFESNTAKARATLASHRFPSAYFLMMQIEESLKQDGVQLSLKASGKILSILFGYESFEELLADEKFNNESLEQVKYIYYDDELAKGLEQIVLDEDSENEDLSADLIFDHLQMLFESEPFELVTIDSLVEYSKSILENDPYEFLNSEGTAGAIAESNTIYDYVDDLQVQSFDFDDGFFAEVTANASGYNQAYLDIPGRSMNVCVEMTSDVLIGKFGLGPIEQNVVNGTLAEFG